MLSEHPSHPQTEKIDLGMIGRISHFQLCILLRGQVNTRFKHPVSLFFQVFSAYKRPLLFGVSCDANVQQLGILRVIFLCISSTNDR